MYAAPGTKTFVDRRDGGDALATMLAKQPWTDPLVLGLARGGVPVADVVADRLDAPLDVLVVRKIGAPGRPEFGVGAVTADGPPYYDDVTLKMLGLTEEDLREACDAERAEARRRVERYQGGHAPERRGDRDVIVVDDGLATGVTATAALRAVREQAPRRLVFAAPVCAADGASRIRSEADEVVCAARPVAFMAVGQWYRDFGQTTDDEVVDLLPRARTTA